MINWFLNLFQNRTYGVARSSRWKTVRKEFLILHPTCAVCGTKKDLEVHHKIPVFVDKMLELDSKNLITLCSTHHLWVGHLGSWKSYNQTVVDDSIYWLGKILYR